MKVLITEPGLYKLPKEVYPKIDFSEINFEKQELFEKHLKENQYNAIFLKLGLRINNQLVLNQKNLEFIISPTTGLNHINLDSSNKKIKVISLKGEYDFLGNITTTAEHAWMLMLMCARSYRYMTDKIENGLWERSDLEISQIAGKKVGIIGMGRLGNILAEYASAFRMKIFYYDIDSSKSPLMANAKKLNLNELIKNSDFIFVAASYEKDSTKIINKNNLSIINKNASIINISRGELIDSSEIVNYVKNHKLKAFATDVLNGDSEWTKKIDINDSVYAIYKYQKNIHLTPHVGGYAREAIELTRDFVLNRFLEELKTESISKIQNKTK